MPSKYFWIELECIYSLSVVSLSRGPFPNVEEGEVFSRCEDCCGYPIRSWMKVGKEIDGGLCGMEGYVGAIAEGLGGLEGWLVFCSVDDSGRLWEDTDRPF